MKLVETKRSSPPEHREVKQALRLLEKMLDGHFFSREESQDVTAVVEILEYALREFEDMEEFEKDGAV